MMKAANIFKKLGILSLALIIGLASCKQDQQKTESGDKTAEKEQKTQDKKTDKKSGDDINYPVPTPYDVTKMLNKAGASYVISLTNDVEKVDQYFTEEKKALNLGVYGADLSYASTYNKTQETTDYLGASKQLTDELGINTSINENIMERVEKNINNTDSLHSIISKSFYDTFEFLNENGKGDISVLVLAGGWIEGLYLSTHLVAENPSEVKKGIAQQKDVLLKLIGLLEEYKGERKAINRTLQSLESIMNIFREANISKDNLNFSEENFDKLMQTTAEIRDRITS